MKVILNTDVANVGQKGQLVDVKPGFFRNFLTPKGLARLATKNLITKAKEVNAQIEADAKAKEMQAKKDKEMLETKALKLSKKLNKKGNLYSKVSEKDLATAIKEQFELSVSDSNIKISEAIKSTGEHTISVKLASSVTAIVNLLVESNEASE